MVLWFKFVRSSIFLLLMVVSGWLATDFSLQSADSTPQLADEEQIVGGRNANPGEFPWQAYLEVAQSSMCGGSLINAEWVLTAAHCVVFEGQLETNVLLVLGEHQLSQTEGEEVLRQATSVIPHPQYNARTADNDIALIKLDAPVNFTNRISPIALVNSPADDSLVTVGTQATVSGWGTLQENGDAADILQTVAVPIVSNATCNAAYQGEITNNMLCAGYAKGGKDACQGDSGGPLVVPSGSSWKQAGIVSFGEGCARSGYYGVYTRVARYINWINNTIGAVTPTPAATATPNATATPTFTPTSTATPSVVVTTPPDNGNYLRNGDFEAGPNGAWSEISNHFGGLGGLILKEPSSSPPIAPLGIYAARLGGLDAEQAALSQNVTLPPSSTAHLHFFYRLISTEDQCGDDRVTLQANSTTLTVFELCQANQNLDWYESIHDLSAYAGESFTLQLNISTDDQLTSYFVIDEASLQIENATATPTPGPEGVWPLYLPLLQRQEPSLQ